MVQIEWSVVLKQADGLFSHINIQFVDCGGEKWTDKADG